MSLNQAHTISASLGRDRRNRSGRLRESLHLGFSGRLRDSCRCQRDYKYLRGLPDHLLNDVGVTRSQIIAAIKHGHL